MSGPSRGASGVRLAAVLAAAVLSGGAALAYELSWSRALVVPLGNSADAAALVLGGFMLGLAVGAWLGGDAAERVRSPLHAYAALEIALAVAAVEFPVLLGGLHRVPLAARYPVAIALVATPCLAMGATFPFIVRALVRDSAGLPAWIGPAYGANTLGAALGACLTGFFGIAYAGVLGSSRAGAGAGLAAALLALLVAETRACGASPRTDGEAEGSCRAPIVEVAARVPPTVALFVAGVGGCVMLAAEVLWARVLTFVFGHDTYAFASLLAVVLVGLALGGVLHRLVARLTDRSLLALLLVLLGSTLLASYWLTSSLVIVRGRDPLGLDGTGSLATSPWLELARELTITPLLVLAPAVAAGALLPAACTAYVRGRQDLGRRVGVVVLVNGIGSMLGALGGSMALGALVGIHDAFRLLATFAVSAGAAVLVVSARRRVDLGGALVPLGLLAVMLGLLPPALPRQLLLSAVGPRHQALLHYEEGRTGTVSVIQNDLNGEKQLVINAVNEVTTRLVHDQSFALLGHLGPLLHPDARRAVMICLGAGLSAGAAVTHPLDRLDVVDLSAAVPRGARHFASENGGVLDSPVVHLHTDDGRRFLLDAREPYDVAIIDSTHPKSVDSWILYTREFYALVRERLAVGGVVVQWLPLHGLSEREFKIVVRTFLSELPTATLWANVGFETYGQVGYAKLVARVGGRLEIDLDRIERTLAIPAVRASLERYGMASAAEILAAYVGGADELEEYTHGVPVQTDDRPLLAYSTPWSRGRRMVPRLLLGVQGTLAPHLTSAPNHALAPRLAATLEAERFVRAGRLERALELAPGSRRLSLFAAQEATTAPYYLALAERYRDVPAVLYEAGTQLGNLGHPEAALAVLGRARELAPHDFRIALHHALALRAVGELSGAIGMLEELRRREWDTALVHQNLGALLLDSGEAGVAAGHLETAVNLDPRASGARLLLAEARLAAGDPQGAQRDAEIVAAQEPTASEAQTLMARVSLAVGDCARAAESAERALRFDPTVAESQRARAAARFCLGDLRGAEYAYEAALHVAPDDAMAHDELGQLLVRRGEVERGILHHVTALEIAPNAAGIAYHLGVALRRAGRDGDARGALCLAQRLAPEHPGAERELRALGEGPDPCRGLWVPVGGSD
ncbi:MAG: hypothetical protein JW751_03730 [Polyangiaceae bacterium]|nr:hypothetical protein [Polyangiaceae bacterium]